MRINKRFGNRRVTISNAKEGDLQKYKTQAKTHELADKERINVIPNDNSRYYLKVQDIDSKLIGLIQVSEIDETVAEIKVSIPNKSWEARYGTEVVHQFVKYFLENRPYSRIYLRKNETVDRYKTERPEMFANNNYYIDIA